MVFAAEVLAAKGISLAGDLLVSTVTEEEATGAGSIASIAHGVRADAGLVPEPTGFDVLIAWRGALYPTVAVQGRAGHAEIPQRHWQDGGAVNAIQKGAYVLDALERLKTEWQKRPDHQHPYLSPGDIVPTIIRGGEWTVSHPTTCEITYDVTYLPAHADRDGWGVAVEREIEEWVRRAADSDAWLAENQPQVRWSLDIPSAEVPEDAPIVQLALELGRAIGAAPKLGGLDTWSDAAAFTRLGGTPSVNFGPRHIEWAHTTDEFVPVEDLVACAQAFAIGAIRFCSGGAS
jgi:acetylornithine deacetylase